MKNCIFCNIVNGTVKTVLLYESELVVAFEDINPQAATHILIVPKRHIRDMNQFADEGSEYISEVIKSISKVAKKFSLNEGYRIINNCGKDGGQEIFHLHFHLLSNKKIGQ